MATSLTSATSAGAGPLQSSHPHPGLPLHQGQSQDHAEPSSGTEQTRSHLLQDSFFPDWKDDASSTDLADPNEMQKNDPLGIQIWKLYSKTKTQLPNRERMDNLSWRMMSMNLKRKEQEQARYVAVTPRHLEVEPDLLQMPNSTDVHSLTSSQQPQPQQQQHQPPTSAPSGIAKLRENVNASGSPASDHMNIDDFILPASIATPHVSPSPPPPPPSSTAASAIPIKTKRDFQEHSQPEFPPSAPPQGQLRHHEFDYVQRRVRKTSIDETRVCHM